ncbi:TniQ protein [Tranquillimonas alkanivorans]|uniref:TniQ protein n=1 Tax=Tranquillimonas alkanivorans TaxID=441119 RepID=A0A1I5WUS5_9RHOB|nr:TniQ protein [Tranquillimonas alkanivorans]
MSWCCRLGVFHSGLPSVTWLKMMQIPRHGVADGSDECISRLSELTGIDEELVRATAISRQGERVVRHRAERFGGDFALRTHTTYCPACLLEDAEPGGLSAGRRVGRVNWMFAPVRTCSVHGTLLVRRGNRGFHERFQDMALVAPNDAELDRLASHAQQRPPSLLQTYVEQRFEGVQAFEWLDAQPLDQAVRASEMLGACLAFGAHTDLDKLTMSQWCEAGTAGFEATSKGPEGIRAALESVEAASRKSKSAGGPQAAYGRLYQWLQFKKSKREPGPVREVVRDYILDTMVIEPGTKLFGEEVLVRRRHSVRTLSATSGVHPRTLNRALVRAGVLPNGDEMRVDARTSFGAAEGDALARRIVNSIPIKRIPEYLNCNRTQAATLVRVGILPQVTPGLGGRGGILTNVATEDLDGFLVSFRSQGRRVVTPSDGMVDVITASEIVKETVTDIVRLVIEGALTRVETLDRTLKFRSVLVDPEEVREVVQAREGQVGLSVQEVAAKVKLSYSAVMALFKHAGPGGFPVLRSQKIVNARGTVRHRIEEKKIARFEAEHVSLDALSEERHATSEDLLRSLQAASIDPVFCGSGKHDLIFRRADL